MLTVLALIGFDLQLPHPVLCWFIAVIAVASALTFAVWICAQSTDVKQSLRACGVIALVVVELGILLLDYGPTPTAASWFRALALEAASGLAGAGVLVGSIVGVYHGAPIIREWWAERAQKAEERAAERAAERAEAARRDRQAFLLGRDAGHAEFSALEVRRRELDSALRRADDLTDRLERNVRDLGDTKAGPQFKKRLDQVGSIQEQLVRYRSRLNNSLADLLVRQAAFGVVREVKGRTERNQRVTVNDLRALIEMASLRALDPLKSEERVWHSQNSREDVYTPISKAYSTLREYLAAFELSSLGLPAEMGELDDALLDAAAREELEGMLGNQWKALDEELQHLDCAAVGSVEMDQALAR